MVRRGEGACCCFGDDLVLKKDPKKGEERVRFCNDKTTTTLLHVSRFILPLAARGLLGRGVLKMDSDQDVTTGWKGGGGRVMGRREEE